MILCFIFIFILTFFQYFSKNISSVIDENAKDDPYLTSQLQALLDKLEVKKKNKHKQT